MSLSYQAILFDCDGVIVDTETLASNILKRLLKDEGLELDDNYMHTHFAGYTTQENIILAEKLLGKPLSPDFLERYKQEFNQTIRNSLEPIEGVRELLELIKTPIAMATNANSAEMNLKLELIGLTERFSTRFAVNDVAHGKPAPDLYLKAAQALDVPIHECLVIEDSIAGIRAGVTAGATVLAYNAVLPAETQLEAGAAHSFSSMYELMQLLGLK